MSALDISRYLDQPAKYYSGVVRLQGAVITDSDENERDLIARRGFRDVLTDAIGANGTPNQGFRVSGVTVVGTEFDLNLDAGTFFLGGIRFDAGPGLTLTMQPDWLQFDDIHGTPRVPGTSDPPAHLVWLEAWEQQVSAREDSELLEIALNGVDTSGRVRRMTHVHATPTEHESCSDAFAELVGELEAQGASFDPLTGELKGTTRLFVETDAAGVAEDLCAPRAEGGYLGADNETIRVQLVEPGRFVWGFSNASPIYRVKAENYSDETGTSRRQLRMLTLPWDQVAQPKVGDVVEIIRWGAVLPNQEKVAERSGFFTRVSRSWQRSDGTLLVEEPVSDAWHAWLSDSEGGLDFQSARDEGENAAYFYMRVWRGTVFTEGEKSIAFTPGAKVELERTGLSLTFDAPGRAGDYWVFSVRPNTPHVIVPWSFQDPGGERPTGPASYLAVLARLDWHVADADGNVPKVDDCRRRFRPLSHQSSCCEITVGDGVHSHGDLRSIQEAIDRLPSTGGKICVLKGRYEEAISLERRHDIVIEGCGRLTELVLPDDEQRTLVGVASCRNITIRGLTLVALHDTAITVTQLEDDETASSAIVLEALHVRARDSAAVFANPVDGFALRDSTLTFEALEQPASHAEPGEVNPGQMPGVVIGGSDLNVLDCRIGGEEVRLSHRAFGGIHVLGGSQVVRIKRNIIQRIGGMGIALGSWMLVEAKPEGSVSVGKFKQWADTHKSYRKQYGKANSYAPGNYLLVTASGCLQVDPDPGSPPTGEDDEPEFEVDAGDPVEFVQIHDNEIVDTGLSGISVHRFFDLAQYAAVIVVRGLEIRNNKILRAAQYELPLLAGSLAVHSAYGGVTLGGVDAGTISDNVISEAGGNDLDPYCGIFVLKANGLVIERNTITENGGDSIASAIRLGQRGGVIIYLASAPQISVPYASNLEKLAKRDYEKQIHTVEAAAAPAHPKKTHAGTPALRVHDNVVVQPDGRALQCLADGPISVCDNQLVSRGAAVQSQWLSLLLGSMREYEVPDLASLARVVETLEADTVAAYIALLGGLCVNIVNIPRSVDRLGEALSGVADSQVEAAPGTVNLAPRLQALLFRAEVMLNDNQFVFDAKNSVTDVGTSSVFVLGADDTSICNNQCQTELVGNDELVLADVTAFSIESVRIANNYVKRLSETQADGDVPDFRSIFSFGLANTTSMNHVTGEIDARGTQTSVMHNLVLIA